MEELGEQARTGEETRDFLASNYAAWTSGMSLAWTETLFLCKNIQAKAPRLLKLFSFEYDDNEDQLSCQVCDWQKGKVLVFDPNFLLWGDSRWTN